MQRVRVSPAKPSCEVITTSATRRAISDRCSGPRGAITGSDAAISDGPADAIRSARLHRYLTASRRPGQFLATRQAIVRQHRRLAAHPLFAACSRRELRTLLRWGDELEVPAGVVILRENAIGNCFVAVHAGQLTLTRDGRATGSVGPGGWT